MKRYPYIVLCISLCFLSGCATALPKKKPELTSQETPPPEHRLVGTIVMVNLQRNFVLIDTDISASAGDGTALKSFSNGTETGVLTVSPERRPPFMIADIVSGSPQKGDQVFE